MVQNFLKAFFLPFMALAVVLSFAAGELFYHVSPVAELAPDMIRSAKNFSFNRHYELDWKMRYLVEISNQDKNRQGTLLWPAEPYSTLLVMVPYRAENLRTQKRFVGRLNRCDLRCEISGRLIVMDEFHELIAAKFPEYAEQRALLPRMVLDTGASPAGLSGYLGKNRVMWGIVASAWVIGAVMFVRMTFFRQRPRY